MSLTSTTYFPNLLHLPAKESATSSDRFKLLMLVLLSIVLFPVVLVASVAWTATDSTRSF